MGLFQHKQHASTHSPQDDAEKTEEEFFDDTFREELKNHGRWYFEKVINENADLFKKDLDAVVVQVKVELKEHITQQFDGSLADVDAYLKEHVAKRLDEQLAQYGQAAKETQEASLKAMTESAQALEEKHKNLAESLEKDVAEQKSLLHASFEENKAQITAMKDAQATAMEWFNQSVEALQDQQKKLVEQLEKDVAARKEALVAAFEDNMASTIEHYLLEALGNSFDLKAQLPAIIQQMEDNKQAIVDDMKL
jgi:hypothetical protein